MTPLFRWMASTGQAWKLMVALVLATGWAVSLAGVVWAINEADWRHERMWGRCLILGGVVTLVWLGSVRCPECRARVVWYFIKHSSAMRWMSDVSSMRECPSCGFDGARQT